MREPTPLATHIFLALLLGPLAGAILFASSGSMNLALVIPLMAVPTILIFVVSLLVTSALVPLVKGRIRTHPSDGVTRLPMQSRPDFPLRGRARNGVRFSMPRILRRVASAGLAVLGFLLCAAMSLVMVLLFTSSVKDLINDVQSPGWPTTIGRIISSSVESFEESGDTYYDPKVKYRYSVNETEYMSNRIRFGGFAPALPYLSAEAERVSLSYPPGDTVDVYYKPSDPSLAVLQPRAGVLRIVIQLALWVSSFVFLLVLAHKCAHRVRSLIHE